MIPILYEDRDLLVCEKPVGVLSQPDIGRSGEDMLTLLSRQLCPPEQKNQPYIGLVHRLDRGVGGVMVFAKHRPTTGILSSEIAARRVVKQYLAVVHGAPSEHSGIWTDFLYQDRAVGKTYVVNGMRKGVKEASLAYRVLQQRSDPTYGVLSLLQIRLHTGRTHQIRVQCASRGMPLLGDGKYGARDHGVPMGLWSYRLTFAHPHCRGKTVDVAALPTQAPFDLFEEVMPVNDLPEGASVV